ncbi:reverse transcriptase [Phytophthora cinnamomi]|uniref:reverse transcriptase n=1 Tax=Phytophthora cinnamomi TaxID=4785 RepID=UPI00355A93CE|nr:reverse transcriptase [Phytophthora cinnamomi]
MMQSRSRATLSYRPQANGQQERSVKTLMQSVTVYAEDPLQQDWDEIVERLVFAINHSQDTTRKETPFYLVHGWDAQSTLKAMSSSLRHDTPKQSDALAWRREVNRQQQIAMEMIREYQATAKTRRAQEHNAKLSRKEKTILAKTRDSESRRHKTNRLRDTTPSSQVTCRSNQVRMSHRRLASRRLVPQTNRLRDRVDPPKTCGIESIAGRKSMLPVPFDVGSRVWLYMERVKPGLTKKLAHRCHGPFRIKKRIEDYAFELELPDRSGYRFYPVVHISRLKLVDEFGDRPKTRFAPDLSTTRG